VINHLSGVDYFFLVVPVSLVLFSWIGAVLWADAHPAVRHVGQAPGRAVLVGRLRGRAREDLPGAGPGPAEPTLATSAADENTGGASTGGQYPPAQQAQPEDAGVGPAAARGAGPPPGTGTGTGTGTGPGPGPGPGPGRGDDRPGDRGGPPG
jgi:hypothetical protein